MVRLSRGQKERIAGWFRIPLMGRLLSLAVRTVVPRHRAGVAMVGFDGQGRILMLRHVFHPTVPWGLPGGWLSRNEAPSECILRELEEETGLEAELGPVVHVSRETIPPHLGMAYLARINPSPMRFSSEIIEAGWFYPDSLPKPVLPFVNDAVRAAMKCLHHWHPMETIDYE